MSPPQGAYSSSAGFRATLWFKNTSATCSLSPDNVPVQAVQGSSRQRVGRGSVSGLVAYLPIVLAHDDRAFASVWIGSISTPAFKTMAREQGFSCSLNDADRLKVVSNATVRADPWPPQYFALSERAAVSTKDYSNVPTGVIEKLPTPAQERHVSYQAAVSEAQDYLNYWHLVGPAAKQFWVGSQRNSTVKLSNGNVLSYHTYSWKSANEFTLLVSLNLHFSDSPGAWNEGTNDCFVTFIRTSQDQQFLMACDAGP